MSTIVNTYDTPVVGAVETAPVTGTVLKEVWGAGGGGAVDAGTLLASGSGSGAYSAHSEPCTAGVTTWTYTVGTGGVGHPATPDINGTAGTASSIVSPAITANGGGAGIAGSSTIPTAATASGGTTNTSGNVPPNGAATYQWGAGAPNGGGNSATQPGAGTTPGGGAGAQLSGIATSKAGGNGRVQFTYTYTGNVIQSLYYQSKSLYPI
jgi:hypothetical protein